MKNMPEHRPAATWLKKAFAGRTRVGLPWTSLLAYIRLVSNPRIFARPVPIAQAWKQVDSWLSLPCIWIPAPTEQHAQFLTPMLEVVANCNQVPDAHLAALAVEHGLELQTADRGFARFPGLRYRDPIRPGKEETAGSDAP